MNAMFTLTDLPRAGLATILADCLVALLISALTCMATLGTAQALAGPPVASEFLSSLPGDRAQV